MMKTTGYSILSILWSTLLKDYLIFLLSTHVINYWNQSIKYKKWYKFYRYGLGFNPMAWRGWVNYWQCHNLHVMLIWSLAQNPWIFPLNSTLIFTIVNNYIYSLTFYWQENNKILYLTHMFRKLCLSFSIITNAVNYYQDISYPLFHLRSWVYISAFIFAPYVHYLRKRPKQS